MGLFQLFILPIVGFSPPCLGWTFTHYAQESLFPRPFSGEDGHISEFTETVTHRVTPTVDNPVPISTYTSAYDRYPYAIHFETILLEPGQGEQLPIEAFASDRTWWDYNVVMTYTRLPDCPGPASASTTLDIDLPTDVNDVISPFSATWTASTSSDWFLEGLATDTSMTVYVKETQIPETLMSHFRDIYKPSIYKECEIRYYHGDGDYSNCKDHEYKIGDTVIGAKYECSNGTFYTGLQPYQIVLIFLGGWMVLILAMGILHSIWRFRDLMTGNEASRGLPIPFICIVPILAFPLMVFYHNGFVARSEEDKEFLAVQWRTTPFRKKVRLWLKYGFTRDYPPMLGDPPIRPRTRPQSMAGESTTVHEEPYEAPPPPYTRNATPPPQHPDVEQNPRNLSTGQGPTVFRPASPPKYESDSD